MEGGEETAAQIVARGGEAIFVQTDVANADDVNALVETTIAQYGRLDVSVNNAGIGGTWAKTADYPQDDWAQVLNVNLTGVFNTFQCGLEPMLAAGKGRRIAIASVAGLRGSAYVSAYCAAKHGVVGLTRALAAELGPKGITVKAICPGYTDTPMLDRTLDNIVEKTGMSRDQAAASLLKGSPTGQFVQPSEIADLVLELCADDAVSRTGEAIAMPEGIAG